MKIECQADPSKREKTYLIEGELDVHQVKALKSRLLADFENEKGWNYTLDLKGVAYLDSSGLGMLVYLKKEITRQGGKLILSNLHDHVLNVIKLTKLEDFFGLS